MDKLKDKLCTLLSEGKAELIDFEDIVGKYSRKKVDAASIQLNELAQAGLLSYTREEYGFRINLYDIDKLKNFL